MAEPSVNLLRRVACEQWRACRQKQSTTGSYILNYGKEEEEVARRIHERTGIDLGKCRRAAYLLYHEAFSRGRVVEDSELR